MLRGMYYFIFVLILYSTDPAQQDKLYLNVTQPNYYTYSECVEEVTELIKETGAWMLDYKRYGLMDAQCKELEGAHKI